MNDDPKFATTAESESANRKNILQTRPVGNTTNRKKDGRGYVALFKFQPPLAVLEFLKSSKIALQHLQKGLFSINLEPNVHCRLS